MFASEIGLDSYSSAPDRQLTQHKKRKMENDVIDTSVRYSLD